MNKLKQKDTGFTIVANKPLCDKGLSLSAKGLYAYLRSKPEGWQFSADRIALECLECVRTIKAILQELEDIGLLTRQRKSSGRVDYIIEHKPQCKICTVKNLHGEESAPISNTELNSNTDIYNNTNTADKSAMLDDNGLAMAKQRLSNRLATEKTTKINTIPPYLVSKDFFNNKSSPYRIKAKEFLVSRGLDKQTADSELDKFISYWTEPTKLGNKQRWELEKTFEIKRRLITWLENFLKYNNNKGNNSNDNNYRRLLHDGSYAINRFGVWVSEKDPNIKIDLHYYPELK